MGMLDFWARQEMKASFATMLLHGTACGAKWEIARFPAFLAPIGVEHSVDPCRAHTCFMHECKRIDGMLDIVCFPLAAALIETSSLRHHGATSRFSSVKSIVVSQKSNLMTPTAVPM